MPPAATDSAADSQNRPTTRLRSLHSYLLAMALFALVPVIAVTGFSVVRAGQTFREGSEARLADTTRALAAAIESEIEGTRSALLTLAGIQGNFQENGVYLTPWLDQAGLYLGGTLTVADPRAAGNLTPAARQTALRALETGMATLSNLIDPQAGRNSHVVLAAPIRIGDSGQRAMILTLRPERIIQSVRDGGRKQSGIIFGVTDGTGRLLARSRDAERLIGRPVPDWKTLTDLGTSSGLFKARTAEGNPVVFSFHTLSGTPGWVVVAGEPLGDFNARWQKPLIALGVGGTVALAIALFAIGWMARQILVPVAALAAHSRHVVSGEWERASAEPPPSRIRELETLRQSIAAAEAVLIERADRERRIAEKLAASERRYRAVAETGTLVFWRRSAETGIVTGATGWRELTGQPEEEAGGDGWLKRIHPDDRRDLDFTWQEARAAGGTFDSEFRILYSNGRWTWVRARGAPVRDDGGDLIEWVGVLEDVDARKQAQARIAHMAHHDALTGLGNRLLLHERLDAALKTARGGNASAAIYIDLDRFKQVNDTLGHLIGDELLRTVARRLSAAAGEDDFIARLGGDEFFILQRQADQPGAVATLAARVVEKLSEPYSIGGHDIVIGASAGIALVDGDAQTPETVLKSADLALYRAKAEGRGRYCFFEPELEARMQAHLLEQALWDLAREDDASPPPVAMKPSGHRETG